MIDVSNFDLGRLSSYDDEGTRIFRLSAGRRCSFYKASFVEERGDSLLIVEFMINLDGVITKKCYDCFVARLGEVSRRVRGPQHENILPGFTGLNLRLWLPHLKFHRYTYLFLDKKFDLMEQWPRS